MTQIAIQAKNRKKQMCASVFMDVEKAFDKVWHHGLLYSLHSHNIPTIYLRFIHSFLTNRYTYFQINKISSPLIKINFGVPQGSALSPILFIIYVANIPKPATSTYISQFADDIKTFTTAYNIDTLQSKLQKYMNQIASFCGKSRISLNEKKTCELIFGRVNKYIEENTTTLKLHNKKIPTTKHAKFLGVTFDQNLNFKQDIKNIASIAKTRETRLYSIFNQKYGPSKQTMIRLFLIYIRPLLEYGHIATITTTDETLKQWETLQTRYIKYILDLPNISRVNTLKYANLTTIRTRLNKLALKWYKNLYTNNNTPMINFIDNETKNYNKMDKYNAPYKILQKLNEE